MFFYRYISVMKKIIISFKNLSKYLEEKELRCGWRKKQYSKNANKNGTVINNLNAKPG